MTIANPTGMLRPSGVTTAQTSLARSEENRPPPPKVVVCDNIEKVLVGVPCRRTIPSSLDADPTFNIALTPHSTWQSPSTWVRDSQELWRNVLRSLRGEPMQHMVSPEGWEFGVEERMPT